MNKMRNGLYLFILLMLTSTLGFGQAWEQIGSPPFHKHHSNGYGLNGKGYVFEGTFRNDGNDQISNEVWEYSPDSDSWKRLPDFPGPGRSIAIGDDWNGKYYYGFGSGANGRLNDLWVFDPVDTSYTELPSCPCTGRSHPAFIAHNDKIFMGSGSSNNGDLRDWWEYDMITQVWTQKPNIPGSDRHHPFQFNIGDYIYVGGGHVNNWNRYDPSTDSWMAIDNAPGGRVAGSQFSYNGKGFLLAGDDASHVHVPQEESFMSYDADNNEWTQLPSLPRGSRWANSSMIIDDVLYFFGGLDDDDFENDSTMWKLDLDIISCLPADDLLVVSSDSTSANLLWTNSAAEDSDTLLWRMVGSTDWNTVPNPQAVYVLDGLSACQDYEFQIISVCGDLSTASETVQFKTDGCCIGPEISINSTLETSAVVEWPEISAANTYEIRWKSIGETDWETGMTNSTEYMFENLVGCLEYECQIKSICNSMNSVFGESVYFRTKGCGACIDKDYCPTPESMDGSYSYIQEVQINDFINTSGNNNGYGNFVATDTKSFMPGETFGLVIETAGNDFTNLNVWVDFNGNGEFANNEMVVDEFTFDDLNSFIIDIPATAALGLSRIRIMTGNGFPNDACENNGFQEGEAEDYCIFIEDLTNVDDQTEDNRLDISISPNPFNDIIHFYGNIDLRSNYTVQVSNILGERVLQTREMQLSNGLDLSSLINGVYLLAIEKENHSKVIKIVKQN